MKYTHKDTSVDETLMAEHDEKIKMQIKNPWVAIKIQGFDNKYKKPLILSVMSAAAVWPRDRVSAKGLSAKATAMKETFHNEITSKELVNKDGSISNHHQQIINLE